MQDLISRTAAIDMFQILAYDDWNQGVSTTWANAYSECAEMIRDFPSTEPERKMGRWEKTITHYPYCSICEWMPEEDEMTHGLYNYCPNCGADMRGEDHETD